MLTTTVATAVAGVSGTADFVTISPNPAHDRVTIHFNKSKRQTSLISMHDLTGKTLFTRSISDSETVLELGDYAPGVYFIKVMDGNAVRMLKITKE